MNFPLYTRYYNGNAKVIIPNCQYINDRILLTKRGGVYAEKPRFFPPFKSPSTSRNYVSSDRLYRYIYIYTRNRARKKRRPCGARKKTRGSAAKILPMYPGQREGTRPYTLADKTLPPIDSARFFEGLFRRTLFAIFRNSPEKSRRIRTATGFSGRPDPRAPCYFLAVFFFFLPLPPRPCVCNERMSIRCFRTRECKRSRQFFFFVNYIYPGSRRIKNVITRKFSGERAGIYTRNIYVIYDAAEENILNNTAGRPRRY